MRTSRQIEEVRRVTTNGETYVFRYTPENRAETLRTLGRYAADPNVGFSWYDAAVVSQHIRKIAHHSS